MMQSTSKLTNLLATGGVLALVAWTPAAAQTRDTAPFAEELFSDPIQPPADLGDDMVVSGDVLAGSGMAVGSTSGNPDEGELQLHRSVQQSVKAIRAFDQNLSLRTDQASFFPNLSLHVDGGVGLGTGSPTADFDIRDNDDNGSAAFRLTQDGSSWAATHNANGRMVFNKIGTGGAEFTVRDRLDADGPTLFVQGSVQGTQFINTSSREVKTAFDALDPTDILAKLAALPVSAWRYIWEDDSAHHVGPVAEDFHRLFGLGDGKTIGTVDADGVLMAAVQGLLQKMTGALAARDAEIAALSARLQVLEEKMRDRGTERDTAETISATSP